MKAGLGQVAPSAHAPSVASLGARFPQTKAGQGAERLAKAGV